MNLTDEGTKYPDINYNPQTICFNNFIEHNNYENPVQDTLGQKFVVYFTIFKRDGSNYLNIVLNGSPIFDTIEEIENVSLNFDYYIDNNSEKTPVSFKPYNTYVSPGGYNVTRFLQYLNEYPLPVLNSFKVHNIYLSYNVKTGVKIFKSEVDYLTASFHNPRPMVFHFANESGDFLKNNNGTKYTLAYNFCKGPITNYFNTIIPRLNKHNDIYYLVCYSENINISANITNFKKVEYSNTLEYHSSSIITSATNINNNYISKSSDNNLEVYSNTIGLPEDILTPYSLINILYTLNNSGKQNNNLLNDGFVTNKIQTISLFLKDTNNAAIYGPYVYKAHNQSQTMILTNIDKAIQKYPDLELCPQTLIFTNFSSNNFNNNEPLQDENGNVFSLIITIYKGESHSNIFNKKDTDSYIGYTNISTSGKIQLGKINGLNWSYERANTNPLCTFNPLLDGKRIKSPKVYTQPVILSDGMILLDFFPISSNNMNISMPFNETANFSNLQIILNINNVEHKFNPAINNLTGSFKNKPIIFTNFKQDSLEEEILVNNYGNPLTYAFNFACDSSNIKYLIAYGEVISSEIVGRKLSITNLPKLNTESAISYSESAYGVEFSPGAIPFSFNEDNTKAYFPSFEGIMIYPHNLFSVTINHIELLLGDGKHKFRLDKGSMCQKLEYLFSITNSTPSEPYKPFPKRFYLISTNKEFPVEPPRPIDFLFSGEMESTITISIDNRGFPAPFTKLKILSKKITLNKKPVTLTFTDTKTGTTHNFTSAFPTVQKGDIIYFGLIEVQGLTTLGYKTFGAFYDRTYVVTPPPKPIGLK